MRTGILLSMALMLANTAIAGESINESRPLASDGDLQISNVKGEIRVTAWDRDEVEITGELGSWKYAAQGRDSQLKSKTPGKVVRLKGPTFTSELLKG